MATAVSRIWQVLASYWHASKPSSTLLKI